MKKDICCRALCALACADDGERGGRDDFPVTGVNRLKQREDGRQTIQINMVE